MYIYTTKIDACVCVSVCVQHLTNFCPYALNTDGELSVAEPDKANVLNQQLSSVFILALRLELVIA